MSGGHSERPSRCDIRELNKPSIFDLVDGAEIAAGRPLRVAPTHNRTPFGTDFTTPKDPYYSLPQRTLPPAPHLFGDRRTALSPLPERPIKIVSESQNGRRSVPPPERAIARDDVRLPPLRNGGAYRLNPIVPGHIAAYRHQSMPDAASKISNSPLESR